MRINPTHFSLWLFSILMVHKQTSSPPFVAADVTANLLKSEIYPFLNTLCSEMFIIGSAATHVIFVAQQH